MKLTLAKTTCSKTSRIAHIQHSNVCVNIYSRALRHILFLFIIATSLQACVSKKSLEDQAAIALNNNLATLTHWKLKGKIAWITAQERKSAYLNWQQREQNMQFTLSNLLGINLATLNYNDQLATLESNGETYTDPSPSWLIYQTTGWEVPILPLSSWVKGAASVDGREYNSLSNTPSLGPTSKKNKKIIKQGITRFKNGLIKQLIPECLGCNAWQIDYKRYENTLINNIEYQLPMDISLTNLQSQATIKIRVSEWSH